MKEYYVYLNDQQQGPFTLEQLAEMGITPETEVWTQGMADWRQAGDVAELTPLLQRQQFEQHIYSTPPPHAPRVEPVPAASRPNADADAGSPWQQPAPAEPPRSRSGVKWLIALLCLLLVVVLLAVTNPDRSKHKDAIVNSSREWLGDKTKALTDPLGDLAPIVGGLVDWIGGHGIDFVIDQYLEVDNYVVCSVGRFNTGSEAKTISLGVLGHVFTFDKGDVDQALARAIERELGVEAGAAPAQPQATPAPADPVDEAEGDEYLVPPVEEADTLDADGADEPGMAEELLDSLAATAKREVVKGAKKWAKRQLEKIGH